MMAASDDIFGPYETGLEILSLHQDTCLKKLIHSTGHADLVKLEDGRWFMVT